MHELGGGLAWKDEWTAALGTNASVVIYPFVRSRWRHINVSVSRLGRFIQHPVITASVFRSAKPATPRQPQVSAHRRNCWSLPITAFLTAVCRLPTPTFHSQEPWIPNRDDRRVIKMLWSTVSEATERSRRLRRGSLCQPVAYTAICNSRQPGTHTQAEAQRGPEEWKAKKWLTVYNPVDFLDNEMPIYAQLSIINRGALW